MFSWSLGHYFREGEVSLRHHYIQNFAGRSLEETYMGCESQPVLGMSFCSINGSHALGIYCQFPWQSPYFVNACLRSQNFFFNEISGGLQ